MFINCSNHKKEFWSNAQLSAAAQWGPIVDFPFPYVKANLTENEIQLLADETVKTLLAMNPDAVMCQGEFTLTYAIVNRLLKQHITVVSACSERHTSEEFTNDGKSIKHAEYEFVRFRKYI